jgi:hypothetical protein
MDPGASGPNAKRQLAVDAIGSGAERQRYRAAPIGGGGDTDRPVGHEECGNAE